MDVLFVSASGSLHGLISRLRESKLRVMVAETVSAAHSQLHLRPPEALIVELQGRDKAELGLLNAARTCNGRILRIAICDQDSIHEVGAVAEAHRVIPRNEDLNDLLRSLESYGRFRHMLDKQARHLVASLDVLPTCPELHRKLAGLRKGASASEVEAVVCMDPVLTAKVMRMAHSIGLGTSKVPKSLCRAIERVGPAEVLSTLALTQLEKRPPVPLDALPMDTFRARSQQVATLAVTLDLHPRPSEVYTAGLLHDLGRLVFSVQSPIPYTRVLRGEPTVPLWEREREALGTSHQELGAGLFTLWGLSQGAIDAARGHHEPARFQASDPTLLAAVHVAVCLLEGAPERIDQAWLKRQGVAVPQDLWSPQLAALQSAAPTGADQPSADQTASAQESNPPLTDAADASEHSPASVALWRSLAETLVRSDPDRFAALKEQLGLIAAFSPAVQRDQDVLVVSATLNALLEVLDVDRTQQLNLAKQARAQGCPRTGTAMLLSHRSAPQPISTPGRYRTP